MAKSAAAARLQEKPHFQLEFPKTPPGQLDQHEEWCRVHLQDRTLTLRFHDYATIYTVPGLYEELFYGRLLCCSPATVVGLLRTELAKERSRPGRLRALDVGAGNGMVGEELRFLGVRSLVGIDLVPEAAAACQRDRPGLYRDYLVGDLTKLKASERARILACRPDLLTCVAALGFGDIPARAFAAAWNLLESPAWIACNIKADFLSERYRFGFSLLMRRLIDRGLFEVKVQHEYRHRLSLAGAPLYYAALVGKKTGPIPRKWFTELDWGE